MEWNGIESNRRLAPCRPSTCRRRRRLTETSAAAADDFPSQLAAAAAGTHPTPSYQLNRLLRPSTLQRLSRSAHASTPSSVLIVATAALVDTVCGVTVAPRVVGDGAVGVGVATTTARRGLAPLVGAVSQRL